MKTVIETQQLSVAYDGNLVLDKVDIRIESGKLVGIIGPNGGGKSSWMKASLNLIPHTGKNLFFGQEQHLVSDCIAYVPQREQIDWNFPITVREVVEMGRLQPKKWIQRFTKTDQQIIDQAIEEVQLTDFQHQAIGKLSGGQQQRAFIARAIAQQAELLMMDEPFVGIDVINQQLLIELLRKMVAADKSVVMVHHDLNMVYEYFDEVHLFNHQLLASGTPDTVFQSAAMKECYGNWIQHA